MLNPAYSFMCQQTITIYNAYKSGDKTRYHRTVIENGAFLDFNRQWRESKTGTSASSSFLLVIPQNVDGKEFLLPNAFDSAEHKDNIYTLRANDKVMLGIGPEMRTPQQWASMVPSKVDGLVVIQSIDPKRGMSGAIVHIEAGG